MKCNFLPKDKKELFVLVHLLCPLFLTLVLWTWIYPDFANIVDPDQLASEESNWSGSTLFAIKYVILYQQHWPSNLIGWQLEMGVAS